MSSRPAGIVGALAHAPSSAWVLLLALILLAGCKGRDPILPATFLPTDGGASTAPLPPYLDVAQQYNANTARLGQFWSATSVRLAWRDDRGRDRREHGDGNLIFVRPNRVALTVEKLGKVYLWTGADDQRFWMFDNQENVAYVGHHRNVGRACAGDMPLPVHPATVPYLLGLMPLPTVGHDNGHVEWLEGYYLVEPPDLPLRLLLDPQTARPVRVDLTDARGRSVVIAQLAEHASVSLGGVASDDWPTVAARADLYVVGREARMTLQMSRQSDGAGRIRDAAFDFDRLVRAHRPRQVIELDADCD